MSGPDVNRPRPGSNAIGSFIIGVSPIGTIIPFDYWATIISQFANSPILTQLIANMDSYLDQTANLDAFYDLIFNVATAQGYGLDVWGKEPPPREHPLLAFDNVLASPHTAGITREARENMGRIAAEQLIDTLDGKHPPRIVNPQVWPLYAERFERTLGFAPRAR